MSKKPKITIPLSAPAAPVTPEVAAPPMTKFERLRAEEMEAGRAKLAARASGRVNELTVAELPEPPAPKIKPAEPELPPAPKMKTIVTDSEEEQLDLLGALDKLEL